MHLYKLGVFRPSMLQKCPTAHEDLCTPPKTATHDIGRAGGG